MQLRLYLSRGLVSTMHSLILQHVLAITFISVHTSQAARVAIIGGGLGGTSAAHFLRESQPTWHLELFERDRIGGRTEELQYAGKTLELGASIIHGQNQYVLSLAKAMNLTAVKGDDTDSSFSIYDGDKFVFKQSGNQVLNTLAVLRRYGISPLRYKWLSVDMGHRFAGVYDLQQQGQSFTTPQELLKTLGLLETTQQDAASYMQDHLSHGLWRYGAERFTDELAGAINRINYNQQNQVLNAMAGLVSYLPAAQPDIYYIKEGNAVLPQKLAAAAALQAVHVGVAVQAVQLRSDRRYDVIAVQQQQATTAAGGDAEQNAEISKESYSQPQQQQQQQGTVKYGPYDAVILASPLEGSNITLQGLPEAPKGVGNRTYQTTVTTYIIGSAVNPGYFKVESLPAGDVFVTNAANTPFTVIANKGHVPAATAAAAAAAAGDLSKHTDSSEHMCEGASQPQAAAAVGSSDDSKQQQLWKVFSDEPLHDKLISQLFINGSVLVSRSWKAYPRFHPPEGFAPFSLALRLCYVNALENAASALEVAAVAAKNCALLLQKELGEDDAEAVDGVAVS